MNYWGQVRRICAWERNGFWQSVFDAIAIESRPFFLVRTMAIIILGFVILVVMLDSV